MTISKNQSIFGHPVEIVVEPLIHISKYQPVLFQLSRFFLITAVISGATALGEQR